MKLTAKLAVIFSVIFVLLFGALMAFVFVKVSNNIATIENTTTAIEIERVEDILKNEISFHSRKQADWSNWDDTYHFIDDLNPEYIKSNLTHESLESLETHLMLFYDKTGTIKHGIKLDDTYTTALAYDANALELVYLAKQILEKNDPTYFIAGITKIDGARWIISARAILTSDVQGPINGVLIFGSRWLENTTGTLSELSKRTIDVTAYDERVWQQLTKVGTEVKSPNSSKTKIIIRDSNMLISSYSLLTDLDDMPIAILHVQAKRLFNDEIIPMVKEIGVMILALGAVCLMCVVLVVRIFIIKRLDVITDFVDSVRFGGITTARLASHGKDEISKLSLNIDRMLNSLFKMKE